MAVRDVAARNLCVLARDELLRLGMTDRQIRRRVACGRFVVLHRGVYLVDSPIAPPGSRELAAVRAAGTDRIAVGGASAALLDDWPLPRHLRIRAERAVELVTMTKRTTQAPGILIRRVRHLDAKDVTTIGPIPVTTTARTLVDLLPYLDERSAERLISELYVGRQKLRRSELAKQVARSGRARGIPLLRGLLAAGIEITDSVAEELLLDAIAEAGLPRPLVGQRVLGYRVDAHWPEHRVIAEVDGFGSHGQRRRTFERDHAKLQDLQLAGLFLFAVTYEQLTRARIRTLAKLARVLSERAAIGG